MDDYPNPDEEFDCMYNDELELLREQEELEQSIGCRRTLDFSEKPSRATAAAELQSTAIQKEQEVNHSTADNPDLIPNPDEHSTKKRTFDDLFGDIEDILQEETLETVTKKCKSAPEEIEEQYSLIEHLLELRHLVKSELNPAGVRTVNAEKLRLEHDKYNISFDVPKFPYVTVKNREGRLIYIRCHSMEYLEEEQEKLFGRCSHSGLIGGTLKGVLTEAPQIMEKKVDEPKETTATTTDISALKQNAEDSTNLWTDLYKPRKYVELLSDESTNRTMLRWIKLWDKVVFNRNVKVKADKAEVNKFERQFDMKLDELGRPHHKVALLCGPPGLGKTTLAHMVAKHAGYNVVEINASDDRSIQVFRKILENATQMQSVLDREQRPNCVVFDEIDGAPAASIDFLIKFISGTAKTRKKKTANHQKDGGFVLKRPIICICNDIYVPALKPLRQIAFVVNFPPTTSARLADRLADIARHQQIKTDSGTLLALADKSNNDIRTCLSVLHFFKSSKKQLTMTDVLKANVGQKDVQTGLFSVWQQIFQIPRNPAASGMHSNSEVSLKMRAQQILNVVNNFGDYERVAQGVFENYPGVNLKNTSLETLIASLDWFCFTDVINSQILRTQNYTLFSYLPYAFVVWHFAFAHFAWPKLTYPTAQFEARSRANKVQSLLAEILKGMMPTIRPYVGKGALTLDILPYLCRIMVPNFRQISINFYTDEEKRQLHRIVSIMIDYNVNYVQERTPEGSYVYLLDPNIEDVALYPEMQLKSTVAYATKQLIAREIEVEKMRRTEVHLIGETSAKMKADDKKKKMAENHLKRWKPKQITKSEVIAKDFFGRTVHTTDAEIADQRINSIHLLPLLNQDQINVLIPVIGDQIQFKQALHQIISNEPSKEIENQLFPSKGLKRRIDDDIIIDTQLDPTNKFQEITESTPMLIVVDSQNSNTRETVFDGTLSATASASTVTDLANSACGLNSSFLSIYKGDVDNFQLRSVLEGDVIGRAVLSKHGNNAPLTSRDRNNICEIIISYFLNTSSKLNNDILSRIVDQIVKILPTEKKTTYYVSPIKKRNSRNNKPEVARGKLVDKHRNKLTALRRITECPQVSVDPSDETSIDEPSRAATDSKLWLLNNREPLQDVLLNWKKSYEIRRISSNKHTRIDTFLKDWPILNDQIAKELIEYDFGQSFKLEGDLLEDSSFENFFQGILKKRKDSLNAVDGTFLQLLEGDITTDSKNGIKLYLLFSLIPPKGRTRLGQKHWKPSKAESRDGFFLHVKIPGDIDKARQEKIDINYKRGTTVQPYIILVGPALNNISASYVVVNENIYKTVSVLDAIDFCFKIIHVLDARYPFECQHIWYLIQWLIYKLHSKKDLKIPYIQELL